MSEKQADRSINFSSFADWCKHKDSLSESARHTVEVLLERAGTSDSNEAEKVLSNLTELNLGYNQITNITPLSALTNLTTLNLHYNQITDLTGLSALINLTTLDLYNNQITDITPLSALTNLTVLDLRNNQITDITGLSALINLTTLDLWNNQITELAGLSALTNLTVLHLGENQITDITPLSALTNLTSLSLRNNQITDLTPLSALINLTTLNLYDNLDLYSNRITDLTGLSALTNLTVLHLPLNQITDITPLSALTNLTTLDLSRNQITEISGLSALTNLTALDLSTNQITEISGLSTLTNLTELDLRRNQITDLLMSREITENYLTLSTMPIDYQKATETVEKIYIAIGLETPKVMVCSSPKSVCIKLFDLLKIDCISQITTGNLVRGDSLLKKLFQSVDLGSLWVFWKAICNQIIPDRHPERLVVHDFEELVEAYPERQRYYSYKWGCNCLIPLTSTDLVNEIHLTEFLLSKFRVTLDEKAEELFRCKKELFENCGWIFPFENVCIICDRPLHIRFDTENRLHAQGESAIAFADGWCLYFHHGVKLPEQYGKVHPDLWQAEWLLSEENAEIRRLLIHRIGYDRICQQLQAVELDSWQEYTLLKIDNADVEPIYLLKMTCPSTGHIHALRVPPDVESAKEAIRWVNWDIDPEEFSVQT